MGRIRCSGSPVVRAKTKTTTDRRVRATSDCSTRNRTNLSTELSAGQLVEEQVVHHGARVPLAERLGGRVRRVHVHDGQSLLCVPIVSQYPATASAIDLHSSKPVSWNA